MAISIQQGDNIDLLRLYPDNHFDSIITDCPYGLGKEPDAVKLLQDWIDHGYHEIKGTGFMGQKWDAFVPQPIFWKECFRVLKPGGYVLAFFGTRTYDWGTMAIRLAGFEIRDMITWHYGSGFPKSLDISKAIDKMAGEEREMIRKMKQPATPKANTFNCSFDKTKAVIIAPSTDKAKQYAGYGTALKPATEPICMARKPIEGTVAENVLKWGTGGINLDGCRIETDEIIEPTFTDKKEGLHLKGLKNRMNGNGTGTTNQLGRFPGNVILDPLMAAEMDKQSGISTAIDKRTNIVHQSIGNGNIEFTSKKPGALTPVYSDQGGASRFFYCAKASQEERNAGCDHLIKKAGVFKNESGRGLSEKDPNKDIQVANFHPTIKPISLMRYLQRLVTPEDGLTLDPFAGSGTSGCAASFEGFDIVLMEMDQTYIPIIEARTVYWQKQANREKYIQDLKDSQTQILFDQQRLFQPEQAPTPQQIKLL